MSPSKQAVFFYDLFYADLAREIAEDRQLRYLDRIAEETL